MEYKTKNLEVRWCDDYKERMERAIEMCEDFYDSDGNYIGKYDPECIPLELRKVNWKILHTLFNTFYEINVDKSVFLCYN